MRGLITTWLIHTFFFASLSYQSYAGHYIPAIAHRIWKGNRHLRYEYQHMTHDLLHIPLAGLAIGNGAIDTEEQIKWFREMAFHNPHGIQIIDEDEYERWEDVAESCVRDARECNDEENELEKEFICQKASNCEGEFFKPLMQQNISYYDITKPCIGPSCQGNIKPITTFLNLDTTKETLGVPSNVTWEECGGLGQTWSDVDRVINFAPYVSELLNDGIPVLIYAGDLDYICNYFGNRAVSLKLEWDYGDNFRSVDDYDWNDGGGLARSSNGLTFLQVFDAGHMVPSDQPEQSLDMIRQFLKYGELT